MKSFVFLALLLVVAVAFGYEDWQRQRHRDVRRRNSKVNEDDDARLSPDRRPRLHRGPRPDGGAVTLGRRPYRPDGGAVTLARRPYRGRQRESSEEDDSREGRREGSRGYPARRLSHARRQQIQSQRLRSSLLQRLMRRLHNTTRWMNFEALPVITGHVEFGPGLAFDWDLDIDGLFEGDVEWWKGPNVCVREDVQEVNTTSEEPESSTRIFRHQFFTTVSCDATDSAYICTTEMGLRDKRRKTTKIYECCHGYEREEGSIGCSRVLELSSVLETAEELGGEEFVEALEGTGFKPLLDEGNFTLFLPVNTSLDVMLPKRVPAEGLDTNVVIVSPEMVSMANSVRKAVASHVVEGFVRSSSFSDEMLLATEDSESSIRINLYSTPRTLVTANCRVVTSTDHLATNGVVHVLSDTMPAVSSSIWEIIRKDPKFSTLCNLLERTDVDIILKEEGQLTLMAPTNDAFLKMDIDRRQELISSDGCIKNVLANHVLPNVICSGVITGQTRSDNLLEKSLKLSRTLTGDLFVDDARMSSVDIMATNGVIHVIDQVLVPDEAKSIQEVVEKAGHNKFFRLIKEAGLAKRISGLDNITVFVPSDEALKDISDEVFDGVRDDTEAMAKLLKYHVVPREISLSNFVNEKLDTFDSDKKINVVQYYAHPFRHRDKLTVQCANVLQTDIKGCQGTVHVIDKVLVPPRGDVLDILYQDSKFSRLVATLKEIGMAEELQTTASDITLFAPTNEAFEELQEQESVWAFLQQHPDVFKQVLRNHVVIGTMCCSGVYPTRWFIHPREQTMAGSSVIIHRRQDDVFINRTPVQTCDVTASNGVVHALNNFLSESIRRYVPIRPNRGRADRGTLWQRLQGLFGRDMSEIDDFLEIDSYWDQGR